jgi:hypothetical protein
MKRTAGLRNLFSAILLGTVLCAAPAAAANSPVKLDAALQRLESADPNLRASALYDLFTLGDWQGQAPRGVASLFRAYPNQTDRIKTALITALERQGEYVLSAKRQQLSVSESDSEVWANLVWVVASLRDPRAIKGLLGAITTGGMATGGLADLGPLAVDAVVERMMDGDAEVRASAVQVLGGFLTRLEMARSNKAAEEKAMAAVLSALDDAGPGVRQAAVGALLGRLDDAEVASRLATLATSDLEVALDREGKLRFPLREKALRVLSAKEADFFYVRRTPATGACRVGMGTDSDATTRLIGPLEAAETATQLMCTHVDATEKDPSLCWSIQPKNACGQ